MGATARRISAKNAPIKFEALKSDTTFSARRLEDILADRVSMDKGQLSATLSKDTTQGEFVKIIAYLASQAEHVGFVLGDMLNQGGAIFGEKYTEAIAATGYSESTLKIFCSVSGLYPKALRDLCPKIGFSAARPITTLPTTEDRANFVQAIADEVKGGAEVPAVKVITKRVKAKLAELPKKQRKARAKKPAEQPYELTSDERDAINLIIRSADGTAAIVTPELDEVMLKMNAENKEAVAAALKPLAELWKRIDKSL